MLSVLPKDADVLHTKCTALLQLSQFADALALLDANAEVAKDFVFERIYALYRTKQHQQALELLKSIPDSAKSQGLLNLEAQVVRWPRPVLLWL